MVREQSLLTAFCMSSFPACEMTWGAGLEWLCDVPGWQPFRLLRLRRQQARHKICAGQLPLSSRRLNDDLLISFAFAGYLQQIATFLVLSIISREIGQLSKDEVYALFQYTVILYILV